MASRMMQEMLRVLTKKRPEDGPSKEDVIVERQLIAKGHQVEYSMDYHSQDPTIFNKDNSLYTDVVTASERHVESIVRDVIMAHDVWDEKAKEVVSTERKKVQVSSKDVKFRRRRTGGAISNMGLVRIMNILLSQKIEKLMRSSSKNLNYVSGRLANSAQVTKLNVGSTSADGKVNVSLFFNYMTIPYAIYEPGNSRGSPARSPKKLIREAMELALVETLAEKSYKRFNFNKRFDKPRL